MQVIREARRLARRLHEEGLVNEEIPTPVGALEFWANTGVWVESVVRLGKEKLYMSIDMDATHMIASIERCKPDPRAMKWVLVASNAFLEEYGRIVGGRSAMPRVAVLEGRRIPSAGMDDSCTYPVIIYRGLMYTEYGHAVIDIEQADPVYDKASIIMSARLPEPCIEVMNIEDGIALKAHACLHGDKPYVYVSTTKGLYRLVPITMEGQREFVLRDMDVLGPVAEAVAKDLYSMSKAITDIMS